MVKYRIVGSQAVPIIIIEVINLITFFHESASVTPGEHCQNEI